MSWRTSRDSSESRANPAGWPDAGLLDMTSHLLFEDQSRQSMKQRS